MIDSAAAPLVRAASWTCWPSPPIAPRPSPTRRRWPKPACPAFASRPGMACSRPGHAPAVVDALAAAIAGRRATKLAQAIQEQGIALDTRAGAAFANFLDEQRESIRTLARERGGCAWRSESARRASSDLAGLCRRRARRRFRIALATRHALERQPLLRPETATVVASALLGQLVMDAGGAVVRTERAVRNSASDREQRGEVVAAGRAGDRRRRRWNGDAGESAG